MFQPPILPRFCCLRCSRRRCSALPCATRRSACSATGLLLHPVCGLGDCAELVDAADRAVVRCYNSSRLPARKIRFDRKGKPHESSFLPNCGARCRVALSCCSAGGAARGGANVNLFPASGTGSGSTAHRYLGRAWPFRRPSVSQIPQWHIDLREQADCVRWERWARVAALQSRADEFYLSREVRFTPVTTPNPKYNSGVFFRNNLDGSIWHQAQTTQAGGYVFGLTPMDGKPTRFNLQKT